MTWFDEQTDDRRTALTDAVNPAQGQRHRDYAGGSLGFAAWLLAADLTCLHRTGVSIFDLSDWAWSAAYQSGDAPDTAVREAVAADDTLGMLRGGAG